MVFARSENVLVYICECVNFALTFAVHCLQTHMEYKHPLPHVMGGAHTNTFFMQMHPFFIESYNKKQQKNNGVATRTCNFVDCHFAKHQSANFLSLCLAHSCSQTHNVRHIKK